MFFGEILQKYSVLPQDVYIIGDDADSEIQAGSELGLCTIFIDTEDKWGDGSATFKVKDLKEAAKKIEECVTKGNLP